MKAVDKVGCGPAPWIPACAGMTDPGTPSPPGLPSSVIGGLPSSVIGGLPSSVIGGMPPQKRVVQKALTGDHLRHWL